MNANISIKFFAIFNTLVDFKYKQAVKCRTLVLQNIEH